MPNLTGLLAGLAGFPQGIMDAQQFQSQQAIRQLALQQALTKQAAMSGVGAALGGQGNIGSLFGMPGASQMTAGALDPTQANPPLGGPQAGTTPYDQAVLASGQTPTTSLPPTPATALTGQTPTPAPPPAPGPASDASTSAATTPAAGTTQGQQAQPSQGGAQQPSLSDQLISQVFRQTNPQAVAQAIKAAKPDIPDDALAMATETLMTMGSSGNKAEQAYALALMREAGLMSRHETPSGSAQLGAGTRTNIAAANLAERQREFGIREQRLATKGGAALLTSQERVTVNQLKAQLQSLNSRAARAGGWAAAPQELQDQADGIYQQLEELYTNAEGRQGGPAVAAPPLPQRASPGQWPPMTTAPSGPEGAYAPIPPQ